MIVGIDEVGRGCLAGPVVVAAAALGEHTIEGLTDSKMLSAKKRQILSPIIKQQAASIGIGWVSAKKIDEIGMSAALKLAASVALGQIKIPYDEIIIDGTIMLVNDPRATTMKKADLLITSVSAASIIAKVARDEYMALIDGIFPGYELKKHVGYGTAQHMAAITNLGPSPIHRLTFAPFTTQGLTRKAYNSSGKLAEEKTAQYVAKLGYEIIDTNWKTKWCEIDVIAKKDGVLHFIEVKYRANTQFGGGLEYVTAKKQAQMRFAARFWLQKNKFIGDGRLAAIALEGPEFVVTEWLPNIDAV
jgi:ribonuclease HII